MEASVEIRTVGVVGCGLMGSGIAEVCARAGFSTIVREIDTQALERGVQRIDQSLSTAVKRGKLTESDRDAARARITATSDLGAFNHCDLVIEAVIEQLDEKRQVYRALDAVCPPHTMLASNTSSIPIVELANSTRRPAQVLGMHFMNPAPVMPLVELVQALTTSEETLDTARAFCDALGKKVIVAQDQAGFIVNLLLVPYLLDAARLYASGAATKQDIDRGLVLGCGVPMGPLTLADFVGLDTLCSIAEILYVEYRDPRYASPPLLLRMVAAGRHGRKSGQGFYDYRDGSTDRPPVD
ncbi:MAG: 3-hydroxyacyl-CoA dehydrogenase family protein [Chloroflexota bacterium]